LFSDPSFFVGDSVKLVNQLVNFGISGGDFALQAEIADRRNALRRILLDNDAACYYAERLGKRGTEL
jgi:hypothetical protein